MRLRPEAEPTGSFDVMVCSDVDQTVEAFAVDEGFKIGADQDVRRGFSGLCVTFYADRVGAACGSGIAEVGLESEGLVGACSGRSEVDGDEGGVINLDADFLNRRDKDVTIAVFSQDCGEKAHKLGAANGCAEIKPRPVACNPHVDIAAIRGIPQVYRRQSACFYGARACGNAFRTGFHDVLCHFFFCHLFNTPYLGLVRS